MSTQPEPRLIILVNTWTLQDYPTAEAPWDLEAQMAAVKAAGFEAISFDAGTPDRGTPGAGEALARHGLRFAGAFTASHEAQFAPKIAASLALGDGPINCQLGTHDTPVERAIALATALMEEAARQGAEVHIETHRNTCTETPEKTAAIIAGVTAATGQPPRVNFDFSHPAIVKHLEYDQLAARLFDHPAAFQASTLWHMRPFNGSHCQVPVTDGKGGFSPEYRALRPFIRAVLDLWLAGPRPSGAFWVVPELGPVPGYGISCFPKSWEDAIVLGNDIRSIWAEAVASA